MCIFIYLLHKLFAYFKYNISILLKLSLSAIDPEFYSKIFDFKLTIKFFASFKHIKHPTYMFHSVINVKHSESTKDNRLAFVYMI